MNLDRVRTQLSMPASHRDIGGDRDRLGFMALVTALADTIPDDEAYFTEENARDSKLLAEAELPAKIDCVTCRYEERQWEAEPCLKCLDRYTIAKPYPMWRRS